MSPKGQRTTLSLSPEHLDSLKALATDLIGSPNVSLLMRNIAEGRLRVVGSTDPTLVANFELERVQKALEDALARLAEVSSQRSPSDP
jgi:hypothetical protein